MKRIALFLLVAVGLVACGDTPVTPTPIPQPNSQMVNVNVNVGQQPGSGAGTNAGCTAEDPAITFLEITSFSGETVLNVGKTMTLNATPKPRASDNCNLSRGIHWVPITPATCSISGEATSFTPDLQGGPSTGQCCAQGSVSGVVGVFCIPVAS